MFHEYGNEIYVESCTLDNNGVLFLTNTNLECLFEFLPENGVTPVPLISNSDDDEGSMISPCRVSVDGDNNIVIADCEKNVICRRDPGSHPALWPRSSLPAPPP